jgi:hypothetical protein
MRDRIPNRRITKVQYLVALRYALTDTLPALIMTFPHVPTSWKWPEQISAQIVLEAVF